LTVGKRHKRQHGYPSYIRTCEYNTLKETH